MERRHRLTLLMGGRNFKAGDPYSDELAQMDAELEQDIAPFRTLNDAPMGMTGHIVFDAWDEARWGGGPPR